MAEAASIPRFRSRAEHLADEALCLSLGAGLTFVLFMGIAHFEMVKAVAPPPEIEDLRAVSAIFEPPPPKVEDHPEPLDISMPLTGIDIEASDSPVKLAVVPPDLDKLVPPADLPPLATIQFGQLLTDLKPRASTSGDFQHIYQQSEVDQPPLALVKTIARVPSRVREDAQSLRVTLLLVVDAEGGVTGIRVLKPSGNAKFDSIVLESVRDEWEFSPAIRKGRKVRCMVQQLVWYKWTEGSPFTI
jgi:TonB family protein